MLREKERKDGTARGAEEDRERGGSKRRRQGDEQEPPERRQQGKDEDGRPKRKRARGVRYGKEPMGHGAELGTVGEGVTVYGPHKVRGN